MKYFEKIAFVASHKGKKYSIEANKETMKIMSQRGMNSDEKFKQLKAKGFVKEKK
jgi:hypothetical protein